MRSYFRPACALAFALVSQPVFADNQAQALTAAVANANRPAEDVARDGNRKPLETLRFSGIHRGDIVADYIANSGYFTRLLSNVVGPKGHVYAVELNEIVPFPNVAKGYEGLKAWAQGRQNLSISTVPANRAIAFDRPLDVFWIAQNYHDLHDKFLGPVDVVAFNKAVYAALKPGGTYVILDHVAPPGARADVTETLHRIDPATVRREVEAAGFRFEELSTVLANPLDPHDIGVFDKSIQGHTDQFLMKFRRPK